MFFSRLNLVAFAFAALVAPTAYADELSIPTTESNQPSGKTHQVVKGDTLWDIAESYLEDPFMWPKIWWQNAQVNNPDLIYPGGTIRIPFELLKPEIRAELVALPVAERVIEVSMSRGVINPLLVESAGYLTDDLNGVGKVVGTYEEHFLMGQGDDVFLKMKRSLEIAPGDRFQVVRPMGKVYHPSTHKRVGKMVRVLGLVTVYAKEGRLHQAKLNRSFDVINSGDILVPYVVPEVFMSERQPDLKGVIVATRENRTIIASEDVVYLDRGRDHGLEPGVALQVVRKGNRIDPDGVWGSFRLPDRSIATLRVLSVQDKTATARLFDALEHIEVGDRFEAAAGPEKLDDGAA
jgi:hypothetical protein